MIAGVLTTFTSNKIAYSNQQFKQKNAYLKQQNNIYIVYLNQQN